MDWGKELQVYNKSGRNLISGVVTLANESTTVLNPARYPEKLVEDLKIFEKRGFIDVTNEITIETRDKRKSLAAVKGIKTAGGSSAIVVEAIDTGSKPIVVDDDYDRETDQEEVPVTSPATQVTDDKMTREQAVELLNSHWKKVEKEVNSINDARKLNFLQVVAQEEGVADKKKEIIEARLKEI